jgi:serine/threonine protein kinase
MLEEWNWLDYFRGQGFPEVVYLATGMEGAVFTLGNGKIAKVWERQRLADILRLQNLYVELSDTGLDFATPVIRQVMEVNSRVVSIEDELEGVSLQSRLTLGDPQPSLPTVEMLIHILRALSDVPATPAMKEVRVLDEDQPFWAGSRDFCEALLGLLDRRVTRFGTLWHQEIQNFDSLYAALQAGLREIGPTLDTAIHGDLFGGNILVTADEHLSAVLDFGLFSAAGDPRFDAAVCAATVNMYGPHAAQVMEALTARFAEAFGYRLEVMRLYQAAYALATSNAYSIDGSDGHFRWCVDQWRKPEILGSFEIPGPNKGKAGDKQKLDTDTSCTAGDVEPTG